MKSLQWALCGFVLALAACTENPTEVTEESATESALESAPQSSTRELPSAAWMQLVTDQRVSTLADTCTWTLRVACRVARCELDANDSVERWDEVCCNAAGVCTTTHWRICGCS